MFPACDNAVAGDVPAMLGRGEELGRAEQEMASCFSRRPEFVHVLLVQGKQNPWAPQNLSMDFDGIFLP